MRTDTASIVLRDNYTQPAYWVQSLDMGFDLDPKATRVAARSVHRRNPASRESDLVLHGDEVELVALRMNGKTLSKRHYRLEHGKLIIPNAPDEVTLEIETYRKLICRTDDQCSRMC